MEAYRLPDWRFDKILFVEKKGLWPVLKAAKLAERFNMAVIASEGYATRAARDLMAAAERTGGITVLTLHDCDGAGYNIARTIEAGTRTSPKPIKIIDLGLSLSEARAAGLEAERVNRKTDLSSDLLKRLDAEEKAFLRGTPTGRGHWSAQRVELNAFTSDALVKFIEAKLRQHGLAMKVCPPPKMVAVAVRDALEHRLRADLTRQVVDLLDLDGLTARLAGEACTGMDLADLHAHLAAALAGNPAESWDAIAGKLAAQAAAGTIASVREHVWMALQAAAATADD